jgi:hypothetical protein
LSAGERSDSGANDESGETPEAGGGDDIKVKSVEVDGARVGERCDRETWLAVGLKAEVDQMVVGSNDAGIGGGGMSWCSSKI